MEQGRPSIVEGQPSWPGSRKGSRPRKDSVFDKPVDLDDVLVNELGEFGRFQIVNVMLVAFPIIMSAFMSEYVFGAATIPHRCRIPECGETTKLETIDPDWVLNAVPFENNNNGFSSCERFESTGTNGTLQTCPANIFNDNRISCEDYVYARDNTVVYEFDLGCQEWYRALAGTLNSVGTLFSLPITGYVSDKYGRRIALIINVCNLSLIGLIRAFSVNYPMYLALQILQTTFGAGTFSTSYIFATEFVGPRYRKLTSAICSSMFAIGQVILGAVAWGIQPWRYMTMAIHIPGFLIIGYYWLLSESVRWLLSKEKFDRAKVVLERVAKRNKKRIGEKSMNALMNPTSTMNKVDDEDTPNLISAIFSSKILLRRVCTTPIWWISTIFVYYGLSINATNLSDSTYLNYILTCAIEIPGFFTAVLVLDRIGRKATLSSGFFLSAVCNVAFVFTPDDLTTVRLIVYLLGKYFISAVLTSLYLYTSELYPTQYRHSLLGFSSMIGRIGSITAPLTPVLADYWHGIPSLMFGGMGLISGILVLTQPETLGTKMPDTLAEAEAIGTPESMRLKN